MLNRRHLRIKVLQILYAYFQSNAKDLLKISTELKVSLERMYDMYLFLLLSFEPMVQAASHRIEDRKKKLMPTQEDLNPNLKFINNEVFKVLSESKELNTLANERKVNWMGVEVQSMFKKMFAASTETETYVLYMLNHEKEFSHDLNFAVQFFKESIANSPFFFNYFEERSIYWMDDLDLCCSMAIKSIKSIQSTGEFTPLPLFKANDDEEEFVHALLLKTVQHSTEYETLIAETAENWDIERIAKMDVILLKMGITELLNFPSIPTSVTLNEYIEISKFYSTPKSNIFINGILDKLVEKLKAEQRLVKTGRGLLN